IGSFLYVFFDTFVGGGLVIDSQLRAGLNGNAGAIGSMPLGLARSVSGVAPDQLLSRASLVNLESRFKANELDAGAVADVRAMQRPWWPHTDKWLREAAPAVALAA